LVRTLRPSLVRALHCHGQFPPLFDRTRRKIGYIYIYKDAFRQCGGRESLLENELEYQDDLAVVAKAGGEASQYLGMESRVRLELSPAIIYATST
jgi:hypothetical protein